MTTMTPEKLTALSTRIVAAANERADRLIAETQRVNALPRKRPPVADSTRAPWRKDGDRRTIIEPPEPGGGSPVRAPDYGTQAEPSSVPPMRVSRDGQTSGHDDFPSWQKRQGAGR